MPTSAPASSSDAPPAAPAAPPAAPAGPAGEDGVTEVLGHILMFFVLSMVLMLSLVAYSGAQSNAAERAARLQADAIAQQVASAVVEAALFVESEDADATYERQLDLPGQIEGREYTIFLEPEVTVPPDEHPDRVRVHVLGYAVEGTAPLFRADAPSGISLSSSDAAGGDLGVHFGTCPSAPATDCLYVLEFDS